MRVHVLCTDPSHPVLPHLSRWARNQADRHDATIATKIDDLTGGDILFLVSVGTIIAAETRGRYQTVIVLHASDLPRGRGWSPLVWQILEGEKTITVTALSAADRVDSGDIWLQRTFEVAPHELVEEIHAKLFGAELALMDEVVANFRTIQPRPQDDRKATYYRKRTTEDSRIDPDRSIAEQFDLLRICDAERYPAFFDHRGQRYKIRIDKLGTCE